MRIANTCCECCDGTSKNADGKVRELRRLIAGLHTDFLSKPEYKVDQYGTILKKTGDTWRVAEDVYLHLRDMYHTKNCLWKEDKTDA